MTKEMFTMEPVLWACDPSCDFLPLPPPPSLPSYMYISTTTTIFLFPRKNSEIWFCCGTADLQYMDSGTLGGWRVFPTSHAVEV